ncbi:U-box domain-containing protein 52 [Linum perenne]
MWMPRTVTERKESSNGVVAVAIDKDKTSQAALKWAIDTILQRGSTVFLIHVKLKPQSSSSAPRVNQVVDANGESPLLCKNPDPVTREMFLPFRCFCTRKDIQCQDIVLEDSDIAKALIEFSTQMFIETLVMGATSKGGFLRFRVTDIPAIVSKGAPDFCTVYIISKGKIQSAKSAARPAPGISPLRNMSTQPSIKSNVSEPPTQQSAQSASKRTERPPIEQARRSVDQQPRRSVDQQRRSTDGTDFFRSPLNRNAVNAKSYGELKLPDTDISFVSSGRTSIDRMFPGFYDNNPMSSEAGRPPRLSNLSDIENDLMNGFESMQQQQHAGGRRSVDISSSPRLSSVSQENDRLSSASQSMDDVEAEMRRLKQEVKQTMEMYNAACKEALAAKHKAKELAQLKAEEERKLEEARLAEENALAIAESEKAKTRAAIEAAEAAQKIAELEAQKRISAEMKAREEAEEKKKALDTIMHSDVRYRKYSIEEIEVATENFSDSRKIGEGGYGPVYRCYLDHTPVAIKVLRPDAAQGMSQFQQEVEVLSCIRHPNMVLLLGACPEYGCLVYEYMANGSLDDRLFRRGNTPPLSWQQRFQIAAEIGTGLLFLHQTKPEPLVHRDLKPGNILLDRNFVSKISDVGLARLVPPSVADSVTQYRMTSTAGTFCYIDPEYQQTGMLGVKSDIYSLGILFLQIITGKPPMGLTHHVDRAIEKDTLSQMLDPAVPDWPVEEAKQFAQLALQCAELRRKDRPDLGKVVLPELNRLRNLAEESMQQQEHLPFFVGNSGVHSGQPSSHVALKLVSLMIKKPFCEILYEHAS